MSEHADNQGRRARRSALYMPASNARALAKARTLPVDVVILDLEDAVAPDRKRQARDAAAAAVAEGGFGSRELVVRVNGWKTPDFAEDAAALAGLPVPVLLPKTDDAPTLKAASAALGARPVWAMVETCRGVLNVAEIAAAGREFGLETLVIGANDLATEMNCRLDGGRHPIWPALSASVIAARAYGLDVLDSVFNAITDEAGFEAECREGAAFGFDGKTLIHPSQIEACNRIFSPSEAEIAWARKVVEAFADERNADVNALAIDGRMVERLHLSGARKVLARAGAA